MIKNDEKNNLTKLVEVTEQIIKVSAVLATFGYMSLRAHLNYLGISSTSSLGLERYLMEFYNLIATLLLDLIFILAGLVIVSLLVFVVARLLAKSHRIRSMSGRIQSWFAKYSSTPIIPSIFMLLILIIYLWMLRSLSKYGYETDVSVGELKVDRLNSYPAESLFFIICFVCLIGYLVFNKFSGFALHAQGHPSKMARYLWVLFAVVVVVLALHLPIIYGRLIRAADYTLIQVITQDEHARPLCGLLVTETSSEITLWRAENGIGQAINLPRSRINMMSTGQVINLLEMAREAAAKPTEARPDCSRFHQP